MEILKRIWNKFFGKKETENIKIQTPTVIIKEVAPEAPIKCNCGCKKAAPKKSVPKNTRKK